MGIERIDLPAELERVRAEFDRQLADALLRRTDLTHAQIEKQFGISNKVIRRVSRQFKIRRRRTGKRRAVATSTGSEEHRDRVDKVAEFSAERPSTPVKQPYL